MKNREQQTSTTPLSVEEYIQLELQSERRHEFINGQLIEILGEKPSTTESQGLFIFF